MTELEDLVEEAIEVTPVKESKATGSIIKRLIPIFNTDIPKEIRAESNKLYSPGLTSNGETSRGLTPEQEKEWLPGVIGISANSPDWESRVQSYWENFQERIEYAGLDLECGLNANGRPINLQHYCLANLAEIDNTVMVSAEMTDVSMSDHYILIDVSKQKAKEADLNKIRRNADMKFAELLNSDKADTTMKYLLIANSKKLEVPIQIITAYDTAQLEVAVRRFRDKLPEAFVKEAASKNVEYKAALYLGVEYGICSLIPHTGQYYMGDDVLGDLTESVTRLKTNSSMYAQLLSDIALIEKKNNR